MKSFIFAPDNSMREMDIPERLTLESLRRVVLNQFRDLDSNIKLIFNGILFGGAEKDRYIYTWELGIGDQHVLYVWDPNGSNAEKRLQCFLELPARRIPVWDGTFSAAADEQDCESLVVFFHQQPSEFSKFKRTFPEAALAMRRGNLNVWFKENRPGVAEIEKYMAKYFEKSQEKEEEPAESPDKAYPKPNPFEPCFFKDVDYEVQLAINKSIYMINYMPDDNSDEIEKEELKNANEELVVRENVDDDNFQLYEEQEELPELPLDMSDVMMLNPPDIAENSRVEVIRPLEELYPRVGRVVYLNAPSNEFDEEGNSLVEKTAGISWQLKVNQGLGKPTASNFEEALKAPEEASMEVMSSQERASAETPPPVPASKVDDGLADDPDEVFEGAASLPLAPSQRGRERLGLGPFPKEQRFKPGSYFSYIRRTRGAGMRDLELLKKPEPMVPPEKMNETGKMPHYQAFSSARSSSSSSLPPMNFMERRRQGLEIADLAAEEREYMMMSRRTRNREPSESNYFTFDFDLSKFEL